MMQEMQQSTESLVLSFLLDRACFVLIGGVTLSSGFRIELIPTEDAVHYGDDGTVSGIIEFERVLELKEDIFCWNKSEIMEILEFILRLHEQLTEIASKIKEE